MNNMIPVPFRNTTLFLADFNGTPYTPMKPIVEGMGLDWSAQHRRLTDDPKRWGMVVMTIPSSGGNQDACCVPLRKLPGWLMTIQPSRVKPEIRDTVIAYQNECDDALWDYWTKGKASSPRMEVVPTDLPTALRAYADAVERRELAERELEASRPKIAFHDQVVSAETLIDFAQAFSLLQRQTGQSFTRKTFLEFT
mgnify:FL=1